MLLLYQQAWKPPTFCKIPFYLVLKSAAFMWMQDYYKKGIPIDSNMIWGKSSYMTTQSKRKMKNLKLKNLMPAKDSLIIFRKKFGFKNVKIGLPWWRSGWESACWCRRHGFEPWSGKIPHAAEQLGPWATTTEPARLEPVLRNKRGRDSERPAHRAEEWPPLATTGESPRTETKTQHTQKSIN